MKALESFNKLKTLIFSFLLWVSDYLICLRLQKKGSRFFFRIILRKKKYLHRNTERSKGNNKFMSHMYNTQYAWPKKTLFESFLFHQSHLKLLHENIPMGSTDFVSLPEHVGIFFFFLFLKNSRKFSCQFLLKRTGSLV